MHVAISTFILVLVLMIVSVAVTTHIGDVVHVNGHLIHVVVGVVTRVVG